MLRRVVIVLTILSGCGPSAPLPQLQQARDLLQRSDATAALDTLAGLNGSSDIHYLRGVAPVSYTHLTLPTKRIV